MSDRGSWGYAYWINEQVIPIVVLQRGTEYTFIVHGGADASNDANYHPFYITNDPEGGYGNKNAADRARETVYAGVDADGNPTAGKLYTTYQPV